MYGRTTFFLYGPKLERQRIDDEAEAESSRQKLLELQTKSAALESTGQAKAEAQARTETHGLKKSRTKWLIDDIRESSEDFNAMKWEFMIMLLYFYRLVITLRN